jgi:hypothetical protein
MIAGTPSSAFVKQLYFNTSASFPPPPLSSFPSYPPGGVPPQVFPPEAPSRDLPMFPSDRHFPPHPPGWVAPTYPPPPFMSPPPRPPPPPPTPPTRWPAPVFASMPVAAAVGESGVEISYQLTSPGLVHYAIVHAQVGVQKGQGRKQRER